MFIEVRTRAMIPLKANVKTRSDLRMSQHARSLVIGAHGEKGDPTGSSDGSITPSLPDESDGIRIVDRREPRVASHVAFIPPRRFHTGISRA
jgi:hypothetical protein